MTDADLVIIDNPAERRFEARLDGQVVGVTEYRLEDATITFTHTETDPAFEGRGVGSGLARAALDAARARELAVVAECPFIRTWMRRHPEYLDLRRRR